MASRALVVIWWRADNFIEGEGAFGACSDSGIESCDLSVLPCAFQFSVAESVPVPSLFESSQASSPRGLVFIDVASTSPDGFERWAWVIRVVVWVIGGEVVCGVAHGGGPFYFAHSIFSHIPALRLRRCVHN